MKCRRETANKLWQIFSFILVAVLLLSSIPLVVFADAGQPEQAHTTLGVSNAETDEGSSKPSHEELEISTLAELIALAERVNGGDSMVGTRVLLQNDIVMTEPWTPIGVSALAPFSGEFDGGGHSILGLHVAPDVNGGLFGYLIDATVSRVFLVLPRAKNSTVGLFHIAINSEVSEVGLRKESAAPLTQQSMFAFSTRGVPADDWDGTSTFAWYNQVDNVLYLDSAEDFSGFRDVVNDHSTVPGFPLAGADHFAGKMIVLTRDIDISFTDWIPIGDSTNLFSGSFVGGGREITGMTVSAPHDGGLFGVVDVDTPDITRSTITNFTLVEPTLTNPNASTGFVAKYGGDFTFSNISVIRPEATTGIDVAGIVHTISEASAVSTHWETSRGATVQDCLLYEPNIQVTGKAAGIIVQMKLEAISRCVIYGGTIESTSAEASGIAYLLDNAGGNTPITISECLVLGTKLIGSTAANGIVSDVTFGAMKDSILADIEVHGATAYLASSLLSGLRGVENIFTDSVQSPPVTNFINNADNGAQNRYVVNNYWDTVTQITNPETTSQGNIGLATGTLANGLWVPNTLLWTPQKGHYPQLGSLMASSNQDMVVASGVAALAILPEDALEMYTGTAHGVRKLTLMKKTTQGGTIIWTGIPAGIEVVGDTDPSLLYKTLFTHLNADIPAFDLTATVTSPTGREFKKVFYQVNIADSTLAEDTTARVPAFDLASPPTNVEEFNVGDLIIRKFNDPITNNPEVVGTVELGVKRPNGQYVVEQSILCDTSDSRFKMQSDGTVTLQFDLREGNEYRVFFPEGMVKEAPSSSGKPKSNLSESYSVEFRIAALEAPVIILKSSLWEGNSGTPLTMAELLGNFTVEAYKGSSILLYDGVNPAPLEEYTNQHGAWDDTNPRKSMGDISKAAAAAGVGPKVYYYLDEHKVIGTQPEALPAVLYIIAINSNQRTDRKMMNINIVNFPTWTSPVPKPVVHMEWTNKLDTVIKTARQGATAAITRSDGSVIPALVDVAFSQTKWDSIKSFKGTYELLVSVFALDQNGKMTDTKMDVMVYLDTPLRWTMTPSPITINYTTKEKVEDRMNVVPYTFSNKELIYEHWIEEKYWGTYKNKIFWENAYREEGTYYVDVTSKPQRVTACTLGYGTCPYEQHPNNVVEDTFIFNLVKTPGEEITNPWGYITDEFLDGSYLENEYNKDTAYSRKIVNATPTSYLLPDYVLQALGKQTYGKLEMTYKDLYRWGIYSDTLDKTRKWGDQYNLETSFVDDDAVTKLLDGLKNGAQIQFEGTGRLFGTVAFELNLDAVGAVFTGIPENDLGLYAYNTKTEALDLISDVYVTDGWASAELSELLPTTYVLMAKNPGDVPVKPAETFTSYLTTTKTKGEYGEWKEAVDSNTRVISKRMDLGEVEKLILGEVASTTNTSHVYGTQTNLPNNNTRTVSPWIIAGTIIVLLGAAGAGMFYVYRRRKGSK